MGNKHSRSNGHVKSIQINRNGDTVRIYRERTSYRLGIPRAPKKSDPFLSEETVQTLLNCPKPADYMPKLKSLVPRELICDQYWDFATGYTSRKRKK